MDFSDDSTWEIENLPSYQGLLFVYIGQNDEYNSIENCPELVNLRESIWWSNDLRKTAQD